MGVHNIMAQIRKASARGENLELLSSGSNITAVDASAIVLGTDDDVTTAFDGTNVEVLPATDDAAGYNFGDGATDLDVKIFLGSTSEHVLFDVGNSRVTLTGIPMYLGAQANTAGSAAALASGLTGILRSYADDGGASVATSSRNILGRTLLTVDQAGGSIRSVQGQLKMATGVDVTTGIYTALQGYVEMAGTHVAQTGSTFSCIDASMEIATSLTIDSGGEACGIHIETTGAGTITNNGTCAALLITGASGAAAWPYGVYMNAADCINGIYLSATTQACEMLVTALPANARGARYVFTCATPAMSDGYGAVEIDLTVSGTATGAVNAASTWINVTSAATLTAGNYAWVHNDGVWLDNSATTTSAIIVWSRVQFAFGTNTGWENLHLFDLNLDIDKDMTSLINVNNLAKTGFTAGAHSSAVTGSIPFIGTGGAVKYIRVHDTAA